MGACEAREFMRQAAIARARIGRPLGEQALGADRLWRHSLGGEPIRLLLRAILEAWHDTSILFDSK